MPRWNRAVVTDASSGSGALISGQLAVGLLKVLPLRIVQPVASKSAEIDG